MRPSSAVSALAVLLPVPVPDGRRHPGRSSALVRQLARLVEVLVHDRRQHAPQLGRPGVRLNALGQLRELPLVLDVQGADKHRDC